MFMTHPALEHALPMSILPPDAKLWRAVELSLRLPWFLAVIEDPEEEVCRDLLLSSEMELAQLIQDYPAAIRSLDIVCPDRYEARWAMHKVKKIWKQVEPSGFTQWIFEHADGAKNYCPPCSNELKQSFVAPDHVLDLD